MQASGGYQVMWLQVDLASLQVPVLSLCMEHTIRLPDNLPLMVDAPQQ